MFKKKVFLFLLVGLIFVSLALPSLVLAQEGTYT